MTEDTSPHAPESDSLGRVREEALKLIGDGVEARRVDALRHAVESKQDRKVFLVMKGLTIGLGVFTTLSSHYAPAAAFVLSSVTSVFVLLDAVYPAGAMRVARRQASERLDDLADDVMTEARINIKLVKTEKDIWRVANAMTERLRAGRERARRMVHLAEGPPRRSEPTGQAVGLLQGGADAHDAGD